MRKSFWLIGIAGIVVMYSLEIMWDQQFYYDSVTKKMWRYCEAGLENKAGFCSGNVITMQWDEALNYCAGLLGSLQWRLPNRQELLSYYHYHGQRKLNYVNLYWMSTTDFDRPELAWYLVPGLDWVYPNYKELDGLVLCVADAE